jgi:hypothetical protein
MPKDKLARALFRSEHPKPDHPGEWARWRRLSLVNENGLIPNNALLQAKAGWDAMAQAEGAGISAPAWVWLGPGNVGGRVRALAVHPSNPNIMFLGSVSGGIWKTTNGGVTFRPVFDNQPVISMGMLAIAPTDTM